MLSFPAGFGYNSSDKRVKPANEKAVFYMNYHIGNMLIYQEFNGTGVCPLCRIRNILENRLADQYMSESVMEDFQRRLVNEKGFCEHHTKMLYARQGKLSLADLLRLFDRSLQDVARRRTGTKHNACIRFVPTFIDARNNLSRDDSCASFPLRQDSKQTIIRFEKAFFRKRSFRSDSDRIPR